MMFSGIHSDSTLAGNPPPDMRVVNPQLSSPAAGTYLPCYLTGEPPVATDLMISRIRQTPGSPTKQQSPAGPPQYSSSPYLQRTDRSGPPTLGLFTSKTISVGNSPGVTSMEIVKESDSISPSKPCPLGSTSVLSVSRNLNQSKSIMSPAQVDPFYTQGESLSPDTELDETWVTVFGFPPATSSYILQQFSHYGTILEHKVNSNGNWMHIHYQSKLQAKKALSKNGKIFGGNIMIGVKQCLEVKMMNDSMKENLNMSNTILNSATFDGEGTSKNRSIYGIRPLSQAYKSVASEHEVSLMEKTPQKSSNIMSKAMEYVFGW